MTGPGISDHALLRFLERAAGVDVEGLRLQLAASLARAHQAASLIGQDSYLVKVGESTFVIREGVCTTVLNSGSPGEQARKLKRGG